MDEPVTSVKSDKLPYLDETAEAGNRDGKKRSTTCAWGVDNENLRRQLRQGETGNVWKARGIPALKGIAS
jgi:hypothetical protein